MGHERTGVLPKSKHWREIVRQIAGSGQSSEAVSTVAQQTIDNVRSRFRRIESDGGVLAAFKFLIALSGSPHSHPPPVDWGSQGLKLPSRLSPLCLTQSLRDWVGRNQQSVEYAGIAQAAAADAIAGWFADNKTSQQLLLQPADEVSEVWRKAATGAGFCELSRLFFAKFTERYLNYFLEREASAVLPNIGDRERFQQQLRDQIESVSQHAFETAKITQSFSAGWFNKHVTSGIPTDREIQGFLSLAFGKLREELSREREG